MNSVTSIPKPYSLVDWFSLMKSRSLRILILATLIQHYQCQFLYQRGHESNKDIPPVAQDNPADNKVDRLIRAKSHSKQKADLVLIIDLSGSIDEKTRRTLKKNLRKLMKSNAIDIGKNNVRVSIVTFATHAKLLISLDQGITRNAVIRAINSISGYGITNLADGFNLATEQFISTKERIDAPKVAILISDGEENCRPDGVEKPPACASKYADCNYLAEHCPRPPSPGDQCKGRGYKSAVFGEFDQLKKAGGNNKHVTLAIIGVGASLGRGKDRLVCWVTEGLYRPLPTYDKLKETIESLVTTLIPKNPEKDCKFVYLTNETCRKSNNTCGRYNYINITQKASSNGRPCPKQKREWAFCRYSACGLAVPKSSGINELELVRATETPDSSKGIAWWTIFVILLGVLASVLLVAVLMVLVVRKRRARRAVTAGVQPSIMQSLTVRTERENPHMAPRSSASLKNIGKAYPSSARMYSQSMQRSVGHANKSVQASSMQDSKQDWTSLTKIRSGVAKSGSLAFVKSASLKTAVAHSKVAQSEKSFVPMSAKTWKAPPRKAFQ